MRDVAFWLNRLERMSGREIVHRAGQQLQIWNERFWYCSYVRNCLDNAPEPGKGSPFRFEMPADRQIMERAERICDDHLDILGLRDEAAGVPLDFQRDGKSGKAVSGERFGKNVNYRDSAKIGDIKYIWEPNRLLFLLPLALAYHETQEPKYLQKFVYFLEEWIRQNRFMMGVNWNSSLELAIRLINWTFCWPLMERALPREFRRKWLVAVWQHCWFIHRNLSLYSSANNHLIGELAGLFIAATALPQWKSSPRWQQQAYRLLIREAERQIFADGVDKEQAVYYHHFVLDLLLLAALVGEACGVVFPVAYWRRLEKMLNYLAALKDAGGNWPQFGDADDGLVVDLGQSQMGVYRSLLNTGAYLFNRKDFLQDPEPDYKTRFFLAAGGKAGTNPESDQALPHDFKDAGVYLLGRDFGLAREEKLIFDCGPLGFLSLAAHGHADALSFYFSAAGCPIFIDPGTYAYHSHHEWRSYFRGTSAHNTLSIDGLNQSDIAGSFMWSRKANSHLLGYQDLQRVLAWHDGYMRLRDPVKHYREIVFDRQANQWRIRDSLVCRGVHQVFFHLHIHPECEIRRQDAYHFDIDFGKGICSLALPEGLKAELFYGSDRPILGWYSQSYDKKIACHEIRVSKIIEGNSGIFTSFQVHFKSIIAVKSK